MKIYECDGCGKQEKARDGNKPREWFERTWGEKNMELHACSRECIKRTAAKVGGHDMVLPV